MKIDVNLVTIYATCVAIVSLDDMCKEIWLNDQQSQTFDMKINLELFSIGATLGT